MLFGYGRPANLELSGKHTIRVGFRAAVSVVDKLFIARGKDEFQSGSRKRRIGCRVGKEGEINADILMREFLCNDSAAGTVAFRVLQGVGYCNADPFL